MSAALAKPISITDLQQLLDCLSVKTQDDKTVDHYITPKAGVVQGGVGYWLALEALARRAYPHAQWVLIGDCGTSAGVAMQAMRDGMRAICCDVAPDVEVKLRAIAVQTQVHFVIPSELTGEVPCFISAASID